MSYLLVVDDDKRIRMIIKKYFTTLGHMVDEAENGLQSVELVKKYPSRYDVIILDMMMPEMNGLEAFEEIRDMKLGVPCIMATAFGNLTLGIEFMKKGGADFIEKPLSMEVLSVKVKQVLENKTLHDKLSAEKISKQALLEASKLKRDFLNDITHEFRTPIHAIINFSKFGGNTQSVDKTKDYFKNINDAASKLLQLIDGLLGYSKMETDVISFDIQKDDLLSVFYLALKEYKGLRGGASFPTTVLNLTEYSTTYFDAKRVKQAFVRVFESLYKYDSPFSQVYTIFKASTIKIGNDDTELMTLPAIRVLMGKFNQQVEDGKVDHTLEGFYVNFKKDSEPIIEELDYKLYENIIRSHRGVLNRVFIADKGLLFELCIPLTN